MFGAKTLRGGCGSPWGPTSLRPLPCVAQLQPTSTRPLSSSAAASSAAASSAAAAAADGISQAQPKHQQQQQQQQPRNAATQAARGSRSRGGDSLKHPRTKPQPFLVRIAGRTSDVKGAAGAIVKRLRQEDMVRVAAIDEDSILKAMISLTAANNMAQANNGQMLVFQPTRITERAAEPPRLPEGSLVMYTSQIMQGEVMTFNMLRVSSSTEVRPLARAIIARMKANSHTVLECYGTAALVVAIKAVAQARNGLLVRAQDMACIVTSTRKDVAAELPEATESSSRDSSSSSSGGGSDGSSGSSTQPSGDAAAGSNGSSRVPLCHRLVLLECEPRNPRALLVRSTVGMSDRVAE